MNSRGLGLWEKNRLEHLRSNFQVQSNRFLCGPTSACIVLNAFRKSPAQAPKTIQSFFDEGAGSVKTRDQVETRVVSKKGSKEPGVTLDELSQMLICLKLRADKVYVDGSAQYEVMKQLMRSSMYESEGQVIINFDRSRLGQPEGGGHFAVLAAIDSIDNKCLLLDPNPSTPTWIQVDWNSLIDSMRTLDGGQFRGFLKVSSM
jgi:hypothetical protein